MSWNGIGALWDSGYYINPTLQYLGWKDDPTIVAPPSPAYAPPIAPQTESAMNTWNLDQQAEAYAQRGIQYISDKDYFGALLADKTPTVGMPVGDPAPKSDNTLLWILGGVVGALLFSSYLGGGRR